MAEHAIPPDIAAMSFEDAMAELEGIVRTLEGGQGKLDESIRAYERGAYLKARCESKLREAQLTVERITRATDAEIETAPEPSLTGGGQS